MSLLSSRPFAEGPAGSILERTVEDSTSRHADLRFDYEIYQKYRPDEEEEADDPYSLPNTSHCLILALAMEYLMLVSALSSFITAGREAPSWRTIADSLALMIVKVIFRIRLGLVRLQCTWISQ
jgi:hypothetical protein